MKAGIIIPLFLFAMVFVAACDEAAGSHWEPPQSTEWWERVTGSLGGFDYLDAGNEIAAFRVDDGSIVGWATVEVDPVSGGLAYLMLIYGPDGGRDSAFEVCFRIWDGASEQWAEPRFTVHPDYKPCDPVTHNLERSAAPEPATLISLAVILLAIARLKTINRRL